MWQGLHELPKKEKSLSCPLGADNVIRKIKLNTNAGHYLVRCQNGSLLSFVFLIILSGG